MTGPTGATKEAIDSFITSQLETLRRAARNIAKNRHSGQPSELADEMVSYLISELYSGRASIEIVATDGGEALFRWSIALFRNSVRKGSGLERSLRRTHYADPGAHASGRVSVIDEDGSPVLREVVDRGGDDWMDAPPARTFEEASLLADGMPPERVAEYLAVSPCVQSLPLHGQILAGLYFVDGMSIRRIAREKRLPQSSVWEMVRDIREILRQCIRENKQPLL